MPIHLIPVLRMVKHLAAKDFQSVIHWRILDQDPLILELCANLFDCHLPLHLRGNVANMITTSNLLFPWFVIGLPAPSSNPVILSKSSSILPASAGRITARHTHFVCVQFERRRHENLTAENTGISKKDQHKNSLLSAQLRGRCMVGAKHSLVRPRGVP